MSPKDKIYHNPRTIVDIKMKLGPLSKLEKKNTMMTLCTNYDIMINFQVYDQFRVMWELDVG